MITDEDIIQEAPQEMR